MFQKNVEEFKTFQRLYYIIRKVFSIISEQEFLF